MIEDPQFTVVSAVMNRPEPFRYTIPSWFQDKRLKRVVIIDWGSDVPFEESLKLFGFEPNLLQRVSVVRVLNATQWVAAHAFNLAIHYCPTEYAIKIDGDVVALHNDWRFMVPDDGEFIAGNHLHHRTLNECHLNGSFGIRCADFWNVQGYDERIDAYGWEDCDLYERLKDNGLKQQTMPPQTLFHLPHGDELRLANQPIDIPTWESIRQQKNNTMKRKPWGPWTSWKSYRRVPGGIIQVEETKS